MLVAITTPATNDRGPQYMEQALAAILQANDLDRLQECLTQGEFPIVYRNRKPIDEERSVHSVVVTRAQ